MAFMRSSCASFDIPAHSEQAGSVDRVRIISKAGVRVATGG